MLPSCNIFQQYVALVVFIHIISVYFTNHLMGFLFRFFCLGLFKFEFTSRPLNQVFALKLP